VGDSSFNRSDGLADPHGDLGRDSVAAIENLSKVQGPLHREPPAISLISQISAVICRLSSMCRAE